jgi:hypothetical protein
MSYTNGSYSYYGKNDVKPTASSYKGLTVWKTVDSNGKRFKKFNCKLSIHAKVTYPGYMWGTNTLLNQVLTVKSIYPSGGHVIFVADLGILGSHKFWQSKSKVGSLLTKAVTDGKSSLTDTGVNIPGVSDDGNIYITATKV